jgi:hypothetical protein
LREGKVEMGENQIRKEFTIHIAAGDYIIEQISTHTYHVKNSDERWPLTPTITLVPNNDNLTTEIYDKDAQEAMKAILEGVAKPDSKE